MKKLNLNSLGLQEDLLLEGFINLKSLDYNNNELTNLDISDYYKLEYLNYSNNYQNEEGIDFFRC